MKALKIIMVVICLGITAACSQLTQLTASNEQKLEHLIAEDRYQQALALIDNTPDHKPDYQTLQQRRASVAKSQQQFIKQTIRQSQTLTKQLEWQKAQQTLSQALSKNAESASLQAAFKTLETKQQRFVAQQQLALAEHQAFALPQSLHHTEKLLLAEPDDSYLLAQRQNLNTQQALASSRLKQQIDSDIAKQRWGSASRYLKAYHSLNGTKSLPKASQLINQQQKRARNQQQKQHDQDSLQRVEKLQQTFQQALNDQQWQTVQQLIPALEPSRQQYPVIGQLIDEAQQSMQQISAVLIQRGQEHYTHGRIDQAIADWQQATQLTPDDSDLHERLQRAIRFKANIEKLQQ